MIFQKLFVSWFNLPTNQVKIVIHPTAELIAQEAIETLYVSTVEEMSEQLNELQFDKYADTSVWVPVTNVSDTLSVQELIEGWMLDLQYPFYNS